MKNSIVIIALVASVFLAGCNEMRNDVKHMKSSWVGIRTVTLYNITGQPIKSWKTDATIEYKTTGAIYFLNDKGKAITINGIFTVEEE